MREITYSDYMTHARDRRRRILALRENGATVEELSALFGVTPARIYAILKAARREATRENPNAKSD